MADTSDSADADTSGSAAPIIDAVPAGVGVALSPLPGVAMDGDLAGDGVPPVPPPPPRPGVQVQHRRLRDEYGELATNKEGKIPRGLVCMLIAYT